MKKESTNVSENKKKKFEDELERIKKQIIKSPFEAQTALLDLLNQKQNIHEKIQIQVYLGSALLAQSKSSEAYKYYYEVLQEAAINQSFQEEKADALEGLGNCCIYLGNLEDGINFCKKSLDIYQKLSLKEKRAKATNTLASLYFSKGNLDLALDFYKKTLNLTENKETLMYMMALGNISVINLLRGEMEKAVKYSRESLKKARSLNFNRGICITQNNLADALRVMGEYSDSIKNLEEALALAKSIKDERIIASINTGFANLWIELGEFKKAYKKLEISLKIYEKINDPIGHILALHGLASYWLVQGQLQKAEDILEKTLQLIDESGVCESEIEILTLLVEVYESIDKIDEAYKILMKADRLSRERNSQIGHAQVLIQRGRISLNKLDFNEAEMSLNEALWHAKKIKHIILQFTGKMLLAENFLVKYLHDTSQKKNYKKAALFIGEAMELTKAKKLIPNYINALIVRGLLYSSQGNQDEAEKTLTEAMHLAKSHDMIIKAQKVQERLLIITTKQSSISAKNQLKNIALYIALEELNAATSSYIQSTITERDLRDTFFVVYKIDEKIGPTIHEVENVDMNNKEMRKKIIFLGSLYSISLGQGHSYHEGIFGPLPFGQKNLRSIIYTLMIDDPSQTNNRSKKKSYVLLCLVFKKKIVPLFFDQQKMANIFEQILLKITSIEEINKKFLNVLRNKIISEFVPLHISQRN